MCGCRRDMVINFVMPKTAVERPKMSKQRQEKKLIDIHDLGIYIMPTSGETIRNLIVDDDETTNALTKLPPVHFSVTGEKTRIVLNMTSK